MPTTTIQPVSNDAKTLRASAPAFAASDALRDRQKAFGEVIARANDAEPLGPEEKARKAAQDFVATAFVQPVLKQLRESNHAAAPFTPGPGERQFQGLMDAQVSRQIVSAKHFPLVDRLAHDLLGPRGTVNNAAPWDAAARRLDVVAR